MVESVVPIGIVVGTVARGVFDSHDHLDLPRLVLRLAIAGLPRLDVIVGSGRRNR